jgi:hypothetical protein
MHNFKARKKIQNENNEEVLCGQYNGVLTTNIMECLVKFPDLIYVSEVWSEDERLLKLWLKSDKAVFLNSDNIIVLENNISKIYHNNDFDKEFETIDHQTAKRKSEIIDVAYQSGIFLNFDAIKIIGQCVNDNIYYVKVEYAEVMEEYRLTVIYNNSFTYDDYDNKEIIPVPTQIAISDVIYLFAENGILKVLSREDFFAQYEVVDVEEDGTIKVLYSKL